MFCERWEGEGIFNRKEKFKPDRYKKGNGDKSSNQVKQMLSKNILAFFLIFPLAGWSFSETELDSLEKSGSKSLSQSPWRTEISFSLKRNTLLNSFYTNNEGQDIIDTFFNPSKEDSLLDPSTWYYAFAFKLNYSLKRTGFLSKKSEYDSSASGKKNRLFSWLEKTELSLFNSFSTPVQGYNRNDSGYGAGDYAHYALGDIVLGSTTSIYAQKGFFSDLVLSLTPFPLSRFSQEAGFLFSFGGGVSLLYFLKKSAGWSLAVSSGHDFNFREYSKKQAFENSELFNTPFITAQRASFIYRQSQSRYIPSNVRLSVSYDLSLNFEKQFNQDLGFGISSSWKIKKQFYLSCALSWKDRVHIYNPDAPKIGLKNPVDWFGIKKTVFSLSGSYSF